MAIKLKFPVGVVFSEKLFTLLLSFTDEALDEVPEMALEAFFSKKENLLCIENLIDIDKESRQFLVEPVKTVLFSKEEKELVDQAADLNANLLDRKIAEALEKGEIASIRALIKDKFKEIYSPRIESAFHFARGMRKALPFSIDKEVKQEKVTRWNAWQGITSAQFAAQLQGKLDADYILENLKFTLYGKVPEELHEAIKTTIEK